MSIVHFILAFFLFILLSPGILVRLPPKGSKWVIASVHGLIFAVMIHIIYVFIVPNVMGLEGFQEGAVAIKAPESPQSAYQKTVQSQQQGNAIKSKTANKNLEIAGRTANLASSKFNP